MEIDGFGPAARMAMSMINNAPRDLSQPAGMKSGFRKSLEDNLG